MAKLILKAKLTLRTELILRAEVALREEGASEPGLNLPICFDAALLIILGILKLDYRLKL